MAEDRIHLKLESSNDYSPYHYDIIFEIMYGKKTIGFIKGVVFNCLKMKQGKNNMSMEEIFSSMGYREEDLWRALVKNDKEYEKNKYNSKQYEETFKFSFANSNYFFIKEFYMEKYFRDRDGFSFALELLPYYICKEKKNFIEIMIVHNPEDKSWKRKVEKYFSSCKNFDPMGETEFLFHNILYDISEEVVATA
ncbi:hypothetical protein [Anaeromicrobium sediminis]|uniref:Uncharacterized protein n=1 Tax=Anaeromicrobium sediminis TaxID=1478221 RepID=A0A267ML43_9FIRM|nr:hypothetical protein [Anaeromicrobium sediminis]PAB60256.1 hypothetical protein CCE28_04980 [Anaeromicrobium sediminis]